MIGQIIGNYKILEKIGEGGMGTVYRGIDVLLERQVAIKLLRPELIHDKSLIERFRTEALALARLNHPNIVMLYSFLPHNGQFCMVLEFVQGETLDKTIKRCGAMPWQQAVPLVCQALNGLEHAHNLKVIHRDIKPANMTLMSSGILKLMDFGIARILQTSRLTRTGHLFGTLEYMSPEQIQGKEIDSRADIYSLGIVLYEMLTGHIPFIRDSDFNLLKAQVEELPLPPRKLMPQLPTDLEKAVLRALAKAPEERFQNAAEFRTELERIMAATPAFRDSRQIPLALPETGLDASLPYSRSSLPASGVFPQASSTSQRKSLLNNIKRYSGVVVSIVMVIVAVIFIGIAYRLGTQPRLPEPRLSQPVPEPASAVSKQEQSGVTQKPTATASSQEQPAAARPQEQAAVIQPQTGPLPQPKAAATDIQPAPVKEPSQTTLKPETAQQQPMAENPPAERASTPAPRVPAPVPSEQLSPPVATPPVSPVIPGPEEPKPEAPKKTAPKEQPSQLPSAPIPKKEKPKPETAKKTAPRKQPPQSPATPTPKKEKPKPETAKKTAPQKQPPQSKSKPRSSTGKGGTGDWKIIY